MRTKLAVHSTGNFLGHSLGQPRRLDPMLAIYSMHYIAMYNTGLRKPRERVKFNQPYLSERITHSFKGIRLIHA